MLAFYSHVFLLANVADFFILFFRKSLLIKHNEVKLKSEEVLREADV